MENLTTLTGIRLGAFVAERHPLALTEALDVFAIEASLTRDERIEMLRGMVLTRATDNRLKTLFTNGEVRCGQTPFQGKGLRGVPPAQRGGDRARGPAPRCLLSRACRIVGTYG